MTAPTPRDLLAETLDAGIREWEDHGGPLLPILHRHVHPALDALVAERVAALAEDVVVEWRTVVMLDRPDGGISMSIHRHTSEADALHFKEWREALRGTVDGRVWPAVRIEIERRVVSPWTARIAVALTERRPTDD